VTRWRGGVTGKQALGGAAESCFVGPADFAEATGVTLRNFAGAAVRAARLFWGFFDRENLCDDRDSGGVFDGLGEAQIGWAAGVFRVISAAFFDRIYTVLIGRRQ
jgi:hypothetical protein